LIKRGRVVVIGDEYLELIALAAGVEAYAFDGDCEKLLNWVKANIESYDAVIYLDTIASSCRDVGDLLEKSGGVKLLIEHPAKRAYKDPKEYYREMTKKVLGVEVFL